MLIFVIPLLTSAVVGAAMISEGVFTIMGPVAVAICIPLLAMGVATLLKPKKYSFAEKEAGKGAWKFK